MGIVRITDPVVFLGLSVEEARNQITGHGYDCRLVWADNHTIVPDYKPDYDPLRINLYAEKNIVTKAVIG
jgi:hypothetical protein